MKEKACLSYWHPKTKEHFNTPRTEIVEYELGVEAAGGATELARKLNGIAGDMGGAPLFLRSGHTSAKHDWEDACYLDSIDVDTIARHLSAIVFYSHAASLTGLPTDVWALREMIPTDPIFEAFNGLPITREARVFASASEGVTHVQPYWPEEALEGQESLPENWRERLENMNRPPTSREFFIDSTRLPEVLEQEFPDDLEWSADFLFGSNGKVYLIDMAPAEISHKHEGYDLDEIYHPINYRMG